MAYAQVDSNAVAPKQIGRYQIRSLLGQGAMGVVYLAHDPQLGREVAIKTIAFPQGMARTQQQQLTRSLLEEARLAARLAHPGIMQVYDAGIENDTPFIVLERLTGHTLEQLVSKQRLSADTALSLIPKILAAIAYAHEQGIVHRDIKPANIMVQPDGQPRIMDFGIARALASAQTSRGVLAGTPRYMAPEQIQEKPVDQRADVFSLGILAYVMLAGSHPFPQENLPALREAIVNQPHPPLGIHAPDLPDRLYVWVEKALEKKAAARFADGRSMLQAFEAAVAKDGDESPSDAKKEMLSFILKRIERQGDFPATAEYLYSVTRRARDERASAQRIAEAILKDFALTNRILRLVNSASYRGRGPAITTISRAVVILGIDTILGLASGLGIFEHFYNRCDVQELKAQSISALMTALHARQLARRAGYEEPEEAFIAAMLFHLGHMTVAFYFPQEHRAIRELIASGEADEAEASRRVMRLSYSEIGEALAHQWRLPEIMQQGMMGLPPGHSGGTRTPLERLQAIVQCADELARATMTQNGENREAMLNVIAQRYEECFPRMTAQRLADCIHDSVISAMDISRALKVDLASLGVSEELIDVSAKDASASSSELLISSARPMLDEDGDSPAAADEGASHESQRQDIVMRTVMEITTALMSPYQISDILMMVIEGMYRGLEFQHVLLGMVSPERNYVFCRFGLGPDIDKVRDLFQFPLTTAGGLPARCIIDGTEAAVLDVAGQRREHEFPANLIRIMRARSVILLPIVILKKPIGCFFVDRGAEQPVPTRQDLRDLRTLANQAVLAIQQSLSRH